MKFRTVIFSFILPLIVSVQAFAQNRGSLYGLVKTLENGKYIPVEGAVVQLSPSGLYSISDSEGRYSFEKLDKGRSSLSIQMIGYVTIDTLILVREGALKMDFVLKESSFRLEEVHVVAEKSKAGESTASVISRQAIDHAMTSSLKDVMQLLPGVAVSNPDLSTAKSLNLRTVGTSMMNSLGTAIIMDGAPLSNNANMEGFASAITGVSSTVAGTATKAVGSVPNSGYDVRTISTDNIESVEVIRGIPSVQYGDLSSGAVIINSRAGADPLTIRLKTDPKIYHVSVSKGLRLGAEKGSLNLGGDYAYSTSSTTERYAYYQRFNTRALYSRLFGKLSTNTSLDLGFGKDTRERNPDDERTMLATGGTNMSYRFNTTGTWNVNRGWLKTITYNISNSFTYKKSFKEQMCTNAMAVYSTNMVSGSTVSNIPGLRLYDKNGKEITDFKEGNRYFSTFTKDSYFSHYDFYSKEINTFAKITANFFKSYGDNSNKIIVGADFKSDGNLGKGLVFDEGAPPLRSSYPESGYRPRPLYEVPFVNQFGLYAEDAFKAKILGRLASLTVGVRYDRVARLQGLSPRMNFSFEILPGLLSLRTGYGIAAKAPTSAYLYPAKAYYDQAQFNNGSYNENQLVLAKTYIFDTYNPDLEMAKNRKFELGFDFKLFGKYTLSVTYYDELMKNGYTFGSNPGSFVLLPYKYYRIAGYNAQSEPLFELTKDTKKFFRFYTPVNTVWEHNRGVEYELNLGRFEALRTSFFLNGAWMRTDASSSGRTYDFRQKGGSYIDSHVSIYEPFVRVSHYEKFLTTLRITHNIPSIGFAVTLTSQLDLYTKNWNTFADNEYPASYISKDDGKVHEFTKSMLKDPAYKYMYEELAAGRFIVGRTGPALAFNINISKEIKDFITASFYVNNFLNSRPLDPSEYSKGAYFELNSPMYFGFELKLKI